MQFFDEAIYAVQLVRNLNALRAMAHALAAADAVISLPDFLYAAPVADEIGAATSVPSSMPRRRRTRLGFTESSLVSAASVPLQWLTSLPQLGRLSRPKKMDRAINFAD